MCYYKIIVVNSNTQSQIQKVTDASVYEFLYTKTSQTQI